MSAIGTQGWVATPRVATLSILGLLPHFQLPFSEDRNRLEYEIVGSRPVEQEMGSRGKLYLQGIKPVEKKRRILLPTEVIAYFFLR
jgi:hypothetical protein